MKPPKPPHNETLSVLRFYEKHVVPAKSSKSITFVMKADTVVDLLIIVASTQKKIDSISVESVMMGGLEQLAIRPIPLKIFMTGLPVHGVRVKKFQTVVFTLASKNAKPVEICIGITGAQLTC
jgi:hypothetical protein